MSQHPDTLDQYRQALEACRQLFQQKFLDYGSAFRVLRPSSVTDQIYIKIRRLVNLQETIDQKIGDETEEDGFIAIVNYGIIALIQLALGASENLGAASEEIFPLYEKFAAEAEQLMLQKNHDYGEAWREMRITGITDLIYQKILRVREIEKNNGETRVSEGLEANYLDMINYALFCLILLKEKGC